MKSREIDRRKDILIKNIEELRTLGQEVKKLESKGDNRRCKLSGPRRNYDIKYSQFILVNLIF